MVLGYIVMAILVFATFSAAYLAMGADRAFEPGSYEVSPLWLVTSFALAFLAAVVGGLVCAFASNSRKATLIFAGLIVVLGLVMAIPAMSVPDPGPRTAEVDNMEAMMKAKQPTWVALVNPFLGAIGVLLGASMRPTKPVVQ